MTAPGGFGPFLDLEALRELRDLNRAALTSVAALTRLTIAAGGAGGANTGARTWAAIPGADAMPCRISPISPATPTSIADQTAYLGRWLAVFDLDAPAAILPGDRLVVTGADVDGTAWTRTLLVLAARSPRTYSAMRSFVCEDVPPGRAA